MQKGLTLHPRLWIDLDNSPHVPLFAPLIGHLRSRGWPVRVTARDFAQTLDLVEQYGLDATPIGAHAGKSKIRKVANLPVRALQLLRAVGSFRPEIALSHGSRTQAIASRLLGIPQVVMFDYEWTEMEIFKRLARHLVCPRAISRERLTEAGIPLDKVTWYDGYKEEMYLADFRPEPGFREALGVGADERLITIRPPGLIGNYHDVRSEELCRVVLETAARDPRNHLVILPKTRLERQLVEAALPAESHARVMIPERALPGLQLLYHSNLAISGGGTMNRESALLNVPTYSIFTGKRAAVDEALEREGRLSFISTPHDVGRIVWEHELSHRKLPGNHTLLYEITGLMGNFVSHKPRSPQ